MPLYTALKWVPVKISHLSSVTTIDIEYNKRLDRQRPCLEGDFNGGSNNIVQTNQFDASDKLYL